MDITRLSAQCITCLLEKNIDKIPAETSEEVRLLYVQKFLKILADAKPTQSAPEVLNDLVALQSELFGAKDDYAQLKPYFNRLMLEKLPQIRKKIAPSTDALRLAVGYAMVGNYIDFGAMDAVDENKLQSMLDGAETMKFDDVEFSNLRADLQKASRVVFLTDNCGEIVLDMLLIETIQKLYPDVQIEVIVRGAPVLNDATLADAKQVGMDQIVSVTDSGSTIAGTCLSKISAEAKAKIDAADVILAKGQGNFETMRYCEKNVYYLFMCKCAMFAERFGVARYSPMLLNDLRMK